VRDQVRFRVGRIPYAAFYEDETIMGFGFPRDEREVLVASEPDKFLMPRPSDMRYQWVCVQLNAIDVDELRELLVDAWRMCVPKKSGCRNMGGPWSAGPAHRRRYRRSRRPTRSCAEVTSTEERHVTRTPFRSRWHHLGVRQPSLGEGQVSANNLAKGTVSQGLRPQAIIRANVSARQRLMRPYPTSRNATGSALT